jgi:selenocysteine-specific elongation factor
LGARTLERSVIIGTAGHIDHGKTELVKALTGVDTDRLPEEKRRGITIDLGFAPLLLDRLGTVGVIDVPGHEDFVRSMVVGASGIDLALLVVAGDEGVMPQTREHLAILKLLQIPRMVVALTKADLVDDEWLTIVRDDVRALFDEDSRPIIVSCSSRSGAGLDELRRVLADALSDGEAKPDDVFRLPVDRAFSVKGTGTVVTGTVWTGELPVDGVVRILPTGRATRVRRIEQHGRPVGFARAGNRAAIALTGTELSDVARGAVLVRDEHWQPTSLFEAVVVMDPNSAATLTPRSWLRLHSGASEVGARLVMNESAGGVSGRILARVSTDAPVVLRGGDRFVLRLPAPLRTIGGGIVVDPYARRRSLPDVPESELDRLSTSASSRLRFVLSAQSGRGARIVDLPVRIGCSPAEVKDLMNSSGARAGRHNLFEPEAVEQVMASIRRIVAEYEIRSPLSLGVPAQTVREGVRASEELADISIREMERAGEIESFGPLLRRRGWVPSLTDRDVEATNRLAHDICAGEQEPPGVGDLISRYGSSVPALLRFLERQGRIVQVEVDRYYDRDALEQMIAQLKGKLVPGQVYVPAQLRDVLGCSRKYLIPFLEFCDRTGVTERRGDGRVLREAPLIQLDTSSARS